MPEILSFEKGYIYQSLDRRCEGHRASLVAVAVSLNPMALFQKNAPAPFPAFNEQQLLSLFAGGVSGSSLPPQTLYFPFHLLGPAHAARKIHTALFQTIPFSH